MEEDTGNRVNYRVDRQTYSQKCFDEEFDIISEPKFNIPEIKKKVRKLRLKSFGFALFPFFNSLRSYYTFQCFALDILSGITMAIFHIPQGMAYGVLAGLRPVNGLYTSFFPVLAYFLFGTSRHVSIGTFSLSSLIFSAPINRLASQFMESKNSSSTALFTIGDEEYAYRLEIATMLTFLIGALQILMGVCQFGILVSYLSGPMISGFMCASAFHIFGSQIKDLFGVKLPQIYGPANLLRTFYEFFVRIKSVNIATLLVSISSIAVLCIFRYFVNPPLKKKFKFTFPIEIVIVTVATLISYFVDLKGRYNVKVVGEIPSGLPPPVVPSFDNVGSVISDVILIGIVTVAMTLSLSKLYATEFGYDILYNQEMIALGISNMFGSFFQCHAACGALARSAVVVSVGMTSQVTSLVSCGILLLVLYFIGLYLYCLPTAVLSSIIVVALISTFEKFKDLKPLYAVSTCDTLIWIVAFLSTFFIDISYGLVIGFGFSVFTVVFRSHLIVHSVLGQADKTDLYADVIHYSKLNEVEGMKIIRFDGPIYFANVESFMSYVFSMSGFDPVKLRNKIALENRRRPNFKSCFKKSKKNSQVFIPDSFSADSVRVADEPSANLAVNHNLHYIILDASSWIFTDTVGLSAVKCVVKLYSEFDVTVLIAGCRPRLWRYFVNYGEANVAPFENFFLTVHDAVLVAESRMQLEETQSTGVSGRRNNSCSAVDFVEESLSSLTVLDDLTRF